jgi:hypothetical protein
MIIIHDRALQREKKEKGGDLMLVSKHRYIHSWKETLGKHTKEEKNGKRKKTRHPSYLNTTNPPHSQILI